MGIEEKAKKHPKSYQKAAVAAQDLYDELSLAQQNFIQDRDDINRKLDLFKKATEEAIKKSLPILKEHRGWKQVLADIASAIVTVISLFTSYFATNRFRLFTPRTDSEEKILNLQQDINNISIEMDTRP